MSKYVILERYFYKDFSIVFCHNKQYPKKLLSYVRNKKWKRTDFICFEDSTIEQLKDKVRKFLKNPNLTQNNQKVNQIKVFYKEHIQKEEEERKQQLKNMMSMVDPMQDFYDDERENIYDIINQQWQTMYGLPNEFFEDKGSPYIDDWDNH